MSAEFKLLDYILFVENVCNVCFHLTAITLMSRLLYFYHFRRNKLRVDSLSSCIQIYLFTHCICSTIGLPYQLFKLVWSTPNLLSGIHTSPFVNTPYVLFLAGVLELNYVTLVPCLVTFLTIERCLIIKMTSTSPKWPFKLLLICEICALVAIWFGEFASYASELPLQLDKVRNCKVAACLAIRTLNRPSLYTKAAFGTINLLGCALFLRTLKSTAINLNTRVVKWTIATELLFDTLPCFTALAFSLATGVSLTNYIGEWGTFFSLLDTCIGSTVYWRILTKRATQVGATLSSQTRAQVAPTPRLHIQVTSRTPSRNLMVSNLQ